MNQIPNKTILYQALFSIGLTLFLFFIDEGYYSFAWMRDPGAWLIFFVYSFVLFAIQIGVFFLAKKWFKDGISLLLSYTLGSGLALYLIIELIFGHV